MHGENIVFLDIDGTLNTEEFQKSCIEIGVPLCAGPVNNLKKLIEFIPNVKVVWSTDWRFEDNETLDSWKNPRLWLERQDWLKDLIIGNTPKKMSSNRHEEIHFWLYDNEWKKSEGKQYRDINNFIILDDCSYGMSRYGKHFIESDYRIGFSDKQLEYAKNFLLTNDYNPDDWFSNKR